MKNKEIERKFFIQADKLPNIDNLAYMDISQGYLANLSQSYIYRLRQILHYSCTKQMIGEEYFQTIKGWGSKVRDEYEINILVQQFHILWPLCRDITIHKYRYELLNSNGGDEHLYLDVYKNELAGLYTVEVEFDSIEKCDAFNPPNWFGPEITEDMRFTNYQLAQHGFSNLINTGYLWKCVDCGEEFMRQTSHKCVNGEKNNNANFILIQTNRIK